MKFSYDWLKELVVKMPPAEALVAGLNKRSLKRAGGRGSNRSVASAKPLFPNSRRIGGMVREIAAVFGLKTGIPAVKKTKSAISTSAKAKIVIKDKGSVSVLSGQIRGRSRGRAVARLWREKLGKRPAADKQRR